jgi:hypothetical protein
MGPTRVDFAGGFIERNQYDACLSPQAADRGSVGIHIFDGQLAFQPKEIS